MSGIEVMGLLSAAISIIDISTKLYGAIKDTSHLPEAFKTVGTRLPLAQDTLQTLLARLEKQTLSDSTLVAIRTLVESCKLSAGRIKDVLKELEAQPEASRLERYKIAVRRPGKQGTVEELMKRLLEDIQLLAANQTVARLTDDQIRELFQAVQELVAVTPSVTFEGDSFRHSGVGDQFNNTGGGPQNIIKGGNQNNAHTITITSS